jgi:GNAT superfamily N-acetyltransferase
MREVIEKTWGWDEAWQRRDFDRRFREYLTSIIECDGHAAGGLLLEWKPDSLYIHELQLLPEYQSQGIGTEVIGRVIEQAAAGGFRSPSPSFRPIYVPNICTRGSDSRSRRSNRHSFACGIAVTDLRWSE